MLTLERAKASPLQVSFMGEGCTSPCVPVPYIQNIGTLSFIDLITIEALRQALPGFPQSTPNLRSLKLRQARRAVLGRSIDPFELLTPTLGHLELFGVPLYPSILHLRSLTAFAYACVGLDLHLDTLLDFLEENHSLNRVDLGIVFVGRPLHRPRRRTPTKNQLQHLTVHCLGTIPDAQRLISGIGLQKGACLNVLNRTGTTLNDILSGISPAHLLNMRVPTLMEYRSYPRKIRSIGPNGEFILQNKLILDVDDPFVEFPLLSLSHVQEFRLFHRELKDEHHTINPIVFDQSLFPALEILAVDCGTSISHLLSALFSNPSSPPSLKTLAFLNCDLDEDFMKELKRYASDRKGTTSAPLHRVVIVNSDGTFPRVSSIHELGKYVPVIDVRLGAELPRDLS